MRLTGRGMTLTGADGASPPLPFIEVEDGEAKVLLALYPKNVFAVSEDVEVVAEPEITPEPVIVGLFGSSVQPAIIAVGDSEVTLSDVVRAACGTMAPEEWNALPSDELERLIDAEVTAMRLAAGRDADNQVVEPKAPAEDRDAADRAQALSDAIDLLEGEHFVKTGPRAGKPKVDAVAEILGSAVTAEEIDAAIAAKEAE